MRSRSRSYGSRMRSTLSLRGGLGRDHWPPAKLSIEPVWPILHVDESAVMGEVEVKGRYRHVSVVHGTHIGAFEILPLGWPGTDPVVGASAGIGLLYDFAGIDAVAEPGEPNAANG